MQAELVQKLIDSGLSKQAARQLALKIISYASQTPEQAWEKILKEILTVAKPAAYPFALHH